MGPETQRRRNVVDIYDSENIPAPVLFEQSEAVHSECTVVVSDRQNVVHHVDAGQMVLFAVDQEAAELLMVVL